MTPFHVGMKVVCVNDGWEPSGATPKNAIPEYWINKGEVLEVFEVHNGQADPNIIYLSFNVSAGQRFRARAFRPAHENRMDELRTLLAPSPSKAKTLVPQS